MSTRIRLLATGLVLLALAFLRTVAAETDERGIGYLALDLERDAGLLPAPAPYAVLDDAVTRTHAVLGAQAEGPWTASQARRLLHTLAGVVSTVCPEQRADTDDGRYGVVLETGVCDCDALSLTYLTLADALGLPLYGVLAPRHMLLRWDDGATSFLWEPTTASEVEADAYALSEEARRQGTYLRPLRRPQLLALLYVRRGNHFYRRQAFARALTDYDQALALDEHAMLAYLNRGATQQALGAYSNAIADYAQALTLDPHEADALYGRGRALVYLGRHDEAIQDFDQALALEGEHADTRYSRGYAQQQLGRYEAAVDDYSAALACDSTLVQALFNRARAYAALGDADLAMADYIAFIGRVRHDPLYADYIPQAQRALLALRDRIPFRQNNI